MHWVYADGPCTRTRRGACDDRRSRKPCVKYKRAFHWSNRIMGHESVGLALCGQGRLRAPRGCCDGKSMKLNTKKAVEYKGRERLKMEKRQGTEGEWGWRRVNSRKGAEE